MKSKLSASVMLALIYLSSLVIGTCIFFVLLWTSILKDNNDLFFRAGLLMLGTTMLLMTFLSLVKLKHRIYSPLTYRDIVIICLLFFFGNWNFYGMIPFNVSRSNSIIILNYLYKNQGQPLSKSKIKTYTQKKYFEDYDSVGIRLHEQQTAGNVMQVNDGYVITSRGIFVANIFNKIATLYNIKNNFFDAFE